MKTYKIIFVLVLAGFFSYQAYSLPGQGTETDPYQVTTKADLNEVRNNLTAFYRQEADIVFDLADFQSGGVFYNDGAGWVPIAGNGTSFMFTGSYDGNGETISNLTIRRGGTANVGLFGHLGHDSDGATIKNLKLINVDIIGGRGTGSLVGRVTGNQKSRIENCSATGTLQGDAATGGLVGSNNSSVSNNGAAEGFRPVIYNCWANVAVSVRAGAPEGDMIKFGGLAGCNQKGLISNSYARGSVTVDNANASRIGGIAGCVEFRGIAINSYATGDVITHDLATNVGGLLGNTGTGNSKGTISSSYYDGQVLYSDLTSRPDNTFGTRHATADMKDFAIRETIFIDWDFTVVWNMDVGKNDGYPYLLDTEPTLTEWIWSGGASGNPSKWDQDGNWQIAGIPPSGAVVVIPDVDSQPVIPTGLTKLYKLTLHSGATLDISSGDSLTVTGLITTSSEMPIPAITGDGLLGLAGSTTQELPILMVNNIVINNYNNVTLSGNLTVNGILAMQNGLLDLNGYTIDLGSSGSLSEIEAENYSSRIYGTSGKIIATRTKDQVNACNLGLELFFPVDVDPGFIFLSRGHSELSGADNAKSILRWFEIEPVNNDNLNATLVFKYVAGDLTFSGDEPSFSLFKRPIGTSELDWVMVESELDASNKKLTATGVQRFSQWTVSSADAPMPIMLLSFEARAVDQGVELNWVTAAEINNDFFTIERSNNGLDFYPIDNISAAGTTSQLHYYQTEDKNALKGLSYYRLKQTDYNGDYEYSAPIGVFMKEIQAEQIVLYPNPGNGQFFITLEGETSLPYRLIDLQGRVITTGIAEPHNVNLISLPALKKGIYTLVFIADDIITRKIQVL